MCKKSKFQLFCFICWIHGNQVLCLWKIRRKCLMAYTICMHAADAALQLVRPMMLWILTTVCISLKCLLLCQIQGFSPFVFLIHLKANLDEIQNLRRLGLCVWEREINVCEWLSVEDSAERWMIHEYGDERWSLLLFSEVIRFSVLVGVIASLTSLPGPQEIYFPRKDAWRFMSTSAKSNSSLGESHLNLKNGSYKFCIRKCFFIRRLTKYKVSFLCAYYV